MIYPGGVVTEFAQHAGIQRKTKATTPRALLLTADQVGEAVVQLARKPRPMWILPWAWTFTVWMNRNLNRLVDRTTINRFTIPEREEELNSSDSHF
jgi:short-subunit dehydrogenase